MPVEPTMVPKSATAARANAYFALARAYWPPRKWDPELPQLMADALGAMPDPLPQDGIRLGDLMGSLLDDPSVAVAHAKLFLGPFEIRAAPWACFYLEEEPRLMGPISQYVARAYAEAGLSPSATPTDAPDHVAHELEFMYYLAFSEVRTGEQVWGERQQRFWRDHLGRWLPVFARTVAEAEAHPFYDALALATRHLCAAESIALEEGQET